MESLVVEVHYLENVIGRLQAVPGDFSTQPWSLGALQYMASKNQLLGDKYEENNNKESIAKLHFSDFRDYSPAL